MEVTTSFKVFGIGGVNSKGMMSNNPRAGIYEAETIRTLDQTGGNPNCNQGGALHCRAHHSKRKGAICITHGK